MRRQRTASGTSPRLGAGVRTNIVLSHWHAVGRSIYEVGYRTGNQVGPPDFFSRRAYADSASVNRIDDTAPFVDSSVLPPANGWNARDHRNRWVRVNDARVSCVCRTETFQDEASCLDLAAAQTSTGVVAASGGFGVLFCFFVGICVVTLFGRRNRAAQLEAQRRVREGGSPHLGSIMLRSNTGLSALGESPDTSVSGMVNSVMPHLRHYTSPILVFLFHDRLPISHMAAHFTRRLRRACAVQRH